MAYNVLHVSAIAGLKSLLTINNLINEFSDNLITDPSLVDGITDNSSGKTILYSHIETICKKQFYSEDYYPTIYYCARGVQRAFVAIGGEEVINDITYMKEPSETLGAVRKAQLDLIASFQYSRRQLGGHITPDWQTTAKASDKAKKLQQIAAMLFDNPLKAATIPEYDYMFRLGEKADKEIPAFNKIVLLNMLD